MGLLRFLYFIKWCTKAKVKLHQEYKRFTPTRWRAVARWVWGMALVSGVLWWQAAAPTPPLTVYFYDIGQGDAIHIRTAEGFDVLIDGGPTGRVVEKLGRTMPFWDDTIELMVLTHPHADHVVGQIEVLKRFNVEKVLATGVLHTTDEYITWLEEVRKQQILLVMPQTGDMFEIPNSKSQIINKSQITNSKLEILWPKDSFDGKRVMEKRIGEGGGLNDTSIVAKLTYGQTSFLFMGDATDKVEEQLVNCHPEERSDEGSRTDVRDSHAREILRCAQNDELKADVLKVGHHGSKYSTSREFIKTVQPKYAVIQVGENRYGHPAFAVLHRLAQAQVKVLRNDQDGDIMCESNGGIFSCNKQ